MYRLGRNLPIGYIHVYECMYWLVQLYINLFLYMNVPTGYCRSSFCRASSCMKRVELPVLQSWAANSSQSMAPAAGTATHARFVLFGDSITQGSFGVGGWGARLADHYARRADVLNRGYSGYTTVGARTPAPRAARCTSPATPPTLVTVFFGANDLRC